ncbi:MAG TPA: hypothetical protein VJ742_00600 [Nitrososphaera sp.]|nr:hypothetical protein [Nitrososphaera sp.]
MKQIDQCLNCGSKENRKILYGDDGNGLTMAAYFCKECGFQVSVIAEDKNA